MKYCTKQTRRKNSSAMKYWIYIIMVIFLLSCSKEGMIKVKTINKVTGTPMPNVTIYVVEQFSNSEPNETVF